MCSFDRTSLFTNIPLKETIEICLDCPSWPRRPKPLLFLKIFFQNCCCKQRLRLSSVLATLSIGKWIVWPWALPLAPNRQTSSVGSVSQSLILKSSRNSTDDSWITPFRSLKVVRRVLVASMHAWAAFTPLLSSRWNRKMVIRFH